MDDHKFDDIIKGKVGDYEVAGFDPAALSALHHQIGSLAAWPWYSRYRTELVLGSGLVICTFILLWNQWTFSSREAQAIEKNNIQLKTQQDQISKLQHEMDNLKRLTQDSVRIEIKELPPSLETIYLQRIRTLEYAIQKMKAANPTLAGGMALNAAASADSQGDSNWISTKDWYLFENSFATRLSPRARDKESVHATPNNKGLPNEIISRRLSTKTIRDLERHKRNGIGIRVGPTLEVSKGFYDVGSSRADLLFGVLGDFIVSPSLSLETGAKYTHRFYEITDREALSNMQLPGVDDNLGPLVTADIDSWILEVPLNLKYRYPLSIKTHILFGAGYSSLMYTKQVFEYYHELDSDPSAQVNTTDKIENFTLSPGTLNISIGLSKELKNKKVLETSLYYQQGLGEIGLEKVRANFLGIRSTYWFTIK